MVLMQPYTFEPIGLFSSFDVHEVIFPQITHFIINQKGESGGTFFEAFTAPTVAF